MAQVFRFVRNGGRAVRGCSTLLSTLLIATVCAGLLAPPSRARASGFSTIGLVPDHYSPITTSPVAVSTNPAALRASAARLTLSLDGTMAYRRATYFRTESDVPEPDDAAGANTGLSKLSNVFAVPNIASSLTLGDFTLGAGVFVPFGGAATWDQNEAFRGDRNYVGAVDSPARWHNLSGLWATGTASVAAAYELKKTGLSVGVTGSYVYTQLEITQATTFVLDDNLTNEGRMHTKLTGSTGSFGLGLHWEALQDKLWTGLSYQAPPGLWQGQALAGRLRTDYGSGRGNNDIRLRQNFPDIMQGGVRYRPDPRFELRATGNWQRFSAVRSQCLIRGESECRVKQNGLTATKNPEVFANFVRRWHDSFGARLAASAFVNARWELFTAVSWDGTAVPIGTLEPGLLDGHDVAGTLGTRIGITDNFVLGTSYMHQVMIPRDSTGKSTLANNDYPNHLPSAGGRYKQTVGVLNLNLELRFDGPY